MSSVIYPFKTDRNAISTAITDANSKNKSWLYVKTAPSSLPATVIPEPITGRYTGDKIIARNVTINTINALNILFICSPQSFL